MLIGLIISICFIAISYHFGKLSGYGEGYLDGANKIKEYYENLLFKEDEL